MEILLQWKSIVSCQGINVIIVYKTQDYSIQNQQNLTIIVNGLKKESSSDNNIKQIKKKRRIINLIIKMNGKEKSKTERRKIKSLMKSEKM